MKTKTNTDKPHIKLWGICGTGWGQRSINLLGQSAKIECNEFFAILRLLPT
jgi:hypothetical protein